MPAFRRQSPVAAARNHRQFAHGCAGQAGCVEREDVHVTCMKLAEEQPVPDQHADFREDQDGVTLPAEVDRLAKLDECGAVAVLVVHELAEQLEAGLGEVSLETLTLALQLGPQHALPLARDPEIPDSLEPRFHGQFL